MANTEIPASNGGGNLDYFLAHLNETGLWGAPACKDKALTHSPTRRIGEVANAFQLPLEDCCSRELLHEVIKALDFVGQSTNGINVFVLALPSKITVALELFDPLGDPDLENPCTEEQPASYGNYLLYDEAIEVETGKPTDEDMSPRGFR